MTIFKYVAIPRLLAVLENWWILLSTGGVKETEYGCVEVIEGCYVIALLKQVELHNVVRNKDFILIASTRFHLMIYRELKTPVSASIEYEWR